MDPKEIAFKGVDYRLLVWLKILVGLSGVTLRYVEMRLRKFDQFNHYKLLNEFLDGQGTTIITDFEYSQVISNHKFRVNPTDDAVR